MKTSTVGPYYAVMFGIPNDNGGEPFWEPISLEGDEYRAIFTTKEQAEEAFKAETKHLTKKEKKRYKVVELEIVWRDMPQNSS